MLIPTSELCPDCQTVLNMDTESQGYECNNGHKFATLPAAPAPVADPAPVVEAEEAKVESIEAPPAAETPAEEAPAVESPAAGTGLKFTVIDDQPLEIELGDLNMEAVEAAATAKPSIDEASKPELLKASGEGTIAELDGGAALIALLIPDPHYSSLVARAEERNVPLNQHMKEMFEFGLENSWFL